MNVRKFKFNLGAWAAVLLFAAWVHTGDWHFLPWVWAANEFGPTLDFHWD